MRAQPDPREWLVWAGRHGLSTVPRQPKPGQQAMAVGLHRERLVCVTLDSAADYDTVERTMSCVLYFNAPAAS